MDPFWVQTWPKFGLRGSPSPILIQSWNKLIICLDVGIKFGPCGPDVSPHRPKYLMIICCLILFIVVLHLCRLGKREEVSGAPPALPRAGGLRIGRLLGPYPAHPPFSPAPFYATPFYFLQIQGSVWKSVKQCRGVGKSVRHILRNVQNTCQKVEHVFQLVFKCPKSVSKGAEGTF